jgi:hypothetical protein
MNDIYVADPWREVDITLDRFDKPNLVLAKAKEYAATHWSDDVSQMMTCGLEVGRADIFFCACVYSGTWVGGESA